MDTDQPGLMPAATAETMLQRKALLDWESARIAEADASFSTGLYATSAEVKEWIDSIGTAMPLPAPRPVRARPL